MRTRILSLAVLAMAAASAFPAALHGQGRTVERTYITTDRPFYCAGEKVSCSLWCMDMSRHPEAAPSDFSGVAYVELYGPEGQAATAKAALIHGRGTATVVLPASIPTGNYRLCAYTAVQKNEVGTDPSAGARTISVFNTMSSARAKGGVEMKEDYYPEQVPAPGDHGSVQLVQDGDGFLVKAARDASVSVSVYHEMGFQRYDSMTMEAFKGTFSKPSGFQDAAIPEYEGEIITATITDKGGRPFVDEDWNELFLSSPSTSSDQYSSYIKDGRARFFTDNIYGDKDLVFSMRSISSNTQSGSLEGVDISIEDPFIGLEDATVPTLSIGPRMSPLLTDLGVAMQVQEAFDSDTLYSRLPLRNQSFTGAPEVVYNLDDYTRFPSMKEVIIEFVSEIRARQSEGRTILQVKCQESTRGQRLFLDRASLILLDGVPVIDHKVVYEMDPLLVKRIEVYPWVYSLGMGMYAGVANFATYRGDMAGTSLGSGTRIMSFKGASVPVAYTGHRNSTRNPMLRKTLYWHPLVDLKAGGQTSVRIPKPDYDGDLRVVVEGLDSDGRGIYATLLIRR